LVAITEILNIYRREKPDIVHQVAMKPVLYGSMAARITGVNYIVNALPGLGYIFTSNDMKAHWLRFSITKIFRFLLNSKGSRLILQNEDDCSLFIRICHLDKEKICLIRGSGVDTTIFHPVSEPIGIPVVVFVSRMLWDKGAGEFLKAAELLRKRKVAARFVLVGGTDLHSPTGVPQSVLEEWSHTGIVEWWGKRENMVKVFAQSSIVCLPSFYGEGVPKVLLEAAACGLSIVTTDAPGCRDVVKNGENGLLVPMRSTVDLANALQKLIEDPILRRRRGVRGREIAVAEFTVEKVVAQTMALYEELICQ
jgi:glycosyltransferase involved in cell wall biosynthesis